MSDSKLMYRLIINFAQGEDMADLLIEVGSYFEREAEHDPEITDRVAMFAETVIPFETENENDTDN